MVELGSVSRAAADLFIAQSALSQQLASLEGELGMQLLSRSVRGVLPTEAGRVFYRHAQVVLRQMEHLRTEVLDSGDNPCGSVSIGVPTSAAIILAGPLIAAVRGRYPGIQLRVIEGMSGHLEEHIINGRVDLGLMFDRMPGSDQGGTPDLEESKYLRYRPLLVENLTLIARRDQIQKSAVTLAEAASHELILPSPANITRRIADEAFNAAKRKPSVIAELDSVDGIISVVGSGLAATLLSRSSLSRASPADDLVAHTISDAVMARRMSLCTNNIVSLSGAAERVMALMTDLTISLVEDGVWEGASLLHETS